MIEPVDAAEIAEIERMAADTAECEEEAAEAERSALDAASNRIIA
jgi:hypothetical protein